MTKINESNLKQAEEALKQISKSVKEYEMIWDSLSPQEKMVAGGVVVNINCPYGEFSFIGILAEPTMSSALINHLIIRNNMPLEAEKKRVID